MSETSFLIEHFETFSYLGIFIVAMFANVAIIVPEEIVLLALGYVVGIGHANGFIVVPIVMAGLLITDTILYTLFKRENRLVMFLYNRLFAWRIQSRLPWLQKHITKVIFFSRFMVQLRFIGPSLAGQMKVPLRTFIIVELAALALYVPLLIWAGAYFRSRIDLIAGGIQTVHNIVIIGIIAVVLFFLLKFLRKIILGNATKTKEGK